ncbi:unnamed protein product [Leptosia nina]|uniref:Uncharacterized protein n=1 Tax=Leptosia nina TaxID=320188 RepID=A0AAV1JXK9_9NEOP
MKIAVLCLFVFSFVAVNSAPNFDCLKDLPDCEDLLHPKCDDDCDDQKPKPQPTPKPEDDCDEQPHKPKYDDCDEPKRDPCDDKHKGGHHTESQAGARSGAGDFGSFSDAFAHSKSFQ